MPLLPALARVVIDTVSSMAGMVIVVTGLSAGALRALAVLTDSPPERVEWMTAAGFAGVSGFRLLCSCWNWPCAKVAAWSRR